MGSFELLVELHIVLQESMGQLGSNLVGPPDGKGNQTRSFGRRSHAAIVEDTRVVVCEATTLIQSLSPI